VLRVVAPAVVLALAACATPQAEMAREQTTVQTFSARVEAVDRASRVVTLVDASGDRLTFRADDAVRNLDQMKPGDVLVGERIEKMLIEARPATDAEQTSPAAVAEAIAGAAPGEKPAGVWVRQAREVFTVASIDEAAGGGELRDPEGELHFVKARDPEVLRRLRVGDTIVVTYTEALRLQVEPGS
jgi:hypothetical protein